MKNSGSAAVGAVGARVVGTAVGAALVGPVLGPAEGAAVGAIVSPFTVGAEDSGEAVGVAVAATKLPSVWVSLAMTVHCEDPVAQSVAPMDWLGFLSRLWSLVAELVPVSDSWHVL